MQIVKPLEKMEAAGRRTEQHLETYGFEIFCSLEFLSRQLLIFHRHAPRYPALRGSHGSRLRSSAWHAR